MTAVRLPPQRDGTGAVLPARATITLVAADERTPVVGVLDPDLGFEAREVLISDATGVVVELTPQALLRMPGGAATFYRIAYGGPGRPDVRVVQVPEADGTVELAALIEAAAIQGGDLAGSLMVELRASAAAADDRAAAADDSAAAAEAAQQAAAGSVQAAAQQVLLAAGQADIAVAGAATATARAADAETAQQAAAGSVQAAAEQVLLAHGQAAAATDEAAAAALSAQTATEQAVIAADEAAAAAASAENAAATAVAVGADARVLDDQQLLGAVVYATDLAGQAVRELLRAESALAARATAVEATVGTAVEATVGTYDLAITQAVYALTHLADLAGVTARAIAGGEIILGAGVAALPSLAAAGDPNTGLYFPSADALALATAGVERLRLDASGRLGIGTTTPSGLLDVADAQVRIRSSRTPASAAAAGLAGEVCWDSAYVYVCIATNTWRRAALTAW